MTQEFSLTEGKISTTLLRFAVPFLLASFLQALYGAADLYVVGRFDTAAGVSAVAIGSQVTIMIFFRSSSLVKGMTSPFIRQIKSFLKLKKI